jgi:hypothetical protein
MLSKLSAVVRVSRYRRMIVGIALLYLVLFLIALRNISLGGGGFEFLSVEWTRMFQRTGAFTFEPMAQLTVPGLTILISPMNILIGSIVAALAGMNLVLTYIAFRQPAACSFNRSTGVLASIPALLAGSACCAPAIVLILGIQVSSLFVTAFQVLIPLAILLLLVSLKLSVDRTNTGLLSE